MKRFRPADLPPRLDLLVIGGGITGAQVARDAALRGLAVALVEKDDFASGTSSRSSKLVHGGLRYLQTLQFGIVRESVTERERLLRLAPHLVDFRPFIYLVYDNAPDNRYLLRLGLMAYDAFAAAPAERRHRMLSPAELARREPAVDRQGLRAAGLYYDALTDDARLVIDVLKSATQAGALVANHHVVEGLVRERGKVVGAEVRDRMTGREMTIGARVVLNATGPWSDSIRTLSEPGSAPSLRLTKGVHLVLRREDYPLGTALFLRSPADGRVVWPIPSRDGRHVYIGTTDTTFTGAPDRVVADDSDIDYLLQAANRALPHAQVARRHIVGSWAGLRPLQVPAGNLANSAVSREHAIRTSDDGVIHILGGKLTTARRIADQAMDGVAATLMRQDGRSLPRSRSLDVPISGGDADGMRQAKTALARAPVAPDMARHWLTRYGANALRVAHWAEGSGEETRALSSSLLSIAEIRHAVHEECAMTVSDVLIRRAGSFYWAADGDVAVMRFVSDVLQQVHGYGVEQRAQQEHDYTSWVSANRPFFG